MLKVLKNKYGLTDMQMKGFAFLCVLFLMACILFIPKGIDSNRRAELLNGLGKYAIGLTTGYTRKGNYVKYVFTVNGKPYYGATRAQKNLWVDRFVRVPGGYYKVKYYPSDPTLNRMDFDSEMHLETKTQKKN